MESSTDDSRKRKRKQTATTTNTLRASHISTSRPKTVSPPKSKLKPCPVCLQPTRPSFFVDLTSTCGCKYCKSCLRESLSTALEFSARALHTSIRNTDFPARCCGQAIDISSQAVEKAIPAKLRTAYHKKMAEMAASGPMYCSNADCKAFIQDLSQVDSVKIVAGNKTAFATCHMCHKKTCIDAACRKLKEDHRGIHDVCPGSIVDPALEKLAAQKAWKRCPKCWAMVEKDRGCNDMRCTCKCEWCYECGERKVRQKSSNKCACGSRDTVEADGEEELPDLDVLLGYSNR